MKTIHKYSLGEDTGLVKVALKAGYQLVRFEHVLAEKALFVWVEEPLRADIPQVEVHFKVIKTGEPVQDTYQYVSTAVDVLGPETYHLYLDTRPQAALTQAA
ncbi:hypothetical protein SAMN05421831_1122 [Allopseudospirillum japonicum]|uniref:DUF7352 domain-containing protein n=1 Tax=Allopseudospirillum japonicum TaxID=64971 RepID=A0A1H6TSL7_9GAMM|nr:hypothetical protein [Allopseudospirillum japonicum]SEI83063.1 hypothetical protein SAMN05421831_1122 [Allopseudospirillum japonicum]